MDRRKSCQASVTSRVSSRLPGPVGAVEAAVNSDLDEPNSRVLREASERKFAAAVTPPSVDGMTRQAAGLVAVARPRSQVATRCF